MRNGRRHGFTLIEVLIVVAVLGILMGIAVINLRDFEQPARDDANGVAFLLKAARSQAMSITGATRVRASSRATLITENSSTGSCMASGTATPTWTANGGTYTLATKTSFVSLPANWDVCFNSRGIPDSAETLTLKDSRNRQFTVGIYLGGSVEVSP